MQYVILGIIAVLMGLVILRKVRQVKKGIYCDCASCDGCATCRTHEIKMKDAKG